MNGVKSIMGYVPIIVCTSSGGIIVPDCIITSENGFAGMLTLDDDSMMVGVAGSSRKKDARETGRQVAMEALENVGLDYAPSYYFMTASPKEEEEYVKGIQDIIGDVPFFGGSAADNKIAGDWKIFCNDESFSDGVAVAFFYTEKPIETIYTGAYHESKNAGIVTKVNGDRKLVEIDGKPALEKYAEWIESKSDNLMGGDLLVASITKPLGVKDALGDLIAIRHPMAGNEDLSMNLGNKIVENTAVIQMEASVDELIDSTGETLEQVNKKLNTPEIGRASCRERV